jgi:hypothetical protein
MTQKNNSITFHLQGSFCSSNCGLTHLRNIYTGSKTWSDFVSIHPIHLFELMIRVNNPNRLLYHPDPKLSDLYGGPLTDKEYRSELSEFIDTRNLIYPY